MLSPSCTLSKTAPRHNVLSRIITILYSCCVLILRVRKSFHLVSPWQRGTCTPWRPGGRCPWGWATRTGSCKKVFNQGCVQNFQNTRTRQKKKVACLALKDFKPDMRSWQPELERIDNGAQSHLLWQLHLYFFRGQVFSRQGQRGLFNVFWPRRELNWQYSIHSWIVLQ